MSEIQPGHTAIRRVFRVLGPLMLIVGLFLLISALGSIGGEKGFLEDPNAHMNETRGSMFMIALGGFVLVGGVGVTMLGFRGAIARYEAAEHAPVIKDTIEYVARGTVQDIAQAVAGSPVCPSCRRQNDADAKFCDGCGEALSNACSKCGKTNDADASFCDGCGEALA